MACATEANRARVSSFLATLQNMQKVDFLNTRTGYLPGEQTLITYTINGSYLVNADDSIILRKCGSTMSDMFNPYQWPAVTTPHSSNVYRIRVGLPNPDRRQAYKDYQLVYVSAMSGLTIGKSDVFTISDIIEIDNRDTDGLLDVTCKVDRDLFKEPMSQPRPVRIRDTSQHRAIVNSGDVQTGTLLLAEDVEYALKSSIEQDALQRVTDLVKQYEAKYGQQIPPRIRELPPPPVEQTVKQKQQKMAQLSQGMATIKKTPLIEVISSVDHMVDDKIRLVLRSLGEEGYTHLIPGPCDKSYLVDRQLEGNTTSQYLDLRKWSTREATASSIKQVELENESIISRLTDDLEALQNSIQSYQTESSWLLEARYRTMNRELSDLERKLDDLTMENVSLRSSLTDGTNKHFLLTIKELEQELERREELIKTLEFDEKLQDHSSPETDSLLTGILTAHIQELEQRLLQKQKEVLVLSSQLTNQQRRGGNSQVIAQSKQNHTSKHQAAKPRPPVQKATSFSAPNDSQQRSGKTDKNLRKNLTTSERGLTAAKLTENHQSWVRLLQKLLSPDNAPAAISQSQTARRSDSVTSSSDSTSSLAIAMRRLFDMKSSTSVASCNSTSTTESIRDAIRHLFDSDSSLAESVSTKSPSFPATPCNSVDSVNAGRALKQTLSAQQTLSSEDLRQALRRLFCVSDSDLKRALPGASDDSISSLGSAMRTLFYSDSDSAVDKEKESTGLSTSNDSLHEALSWLFRQSSLAELSSSSSTDIIWSLFESQPEEFAGVDVRQVNNKRQRTSDSQSARNSCRCHPTRLQSGNSGRKNPSLSSVIRSSSPDRDVNITYPKSNKQSTQTPRSMIPRPIAARTPMPRPIFQQNEDAVGFIMTAGVHCMSDYTDARGQKRQSKCLRSLNANSRHPVICNHQTKKRLQHKRPVKRRCPHCSKRVADINTQSMLHKIGHLDNTSRLTDVSI